jgi:hypothetical protein
MAKSSAAKNVVEFKAGLYTATTQLTADLQVIHRRCENDEPGGGGSQKSRSGVYVLRRQTWSASSLEEKANGVADEVDTFHCQHFYLIFLVKKRFRQRKFLTRSSGNTAPTKRCHGNSAMGAPN